MKKKITFLTAAFFLSAVPYMSATGAEVQSAGNPDYDVVIVGGTPGGIMAAVSAAREGKDCILLERSGHIGGLPSNGLGATDIATRGATTGLFGRFIELNRQHYVSEYGQDSDQVKKCSGGYHFESGVAEENFWKMISEAGPGRIEVRTMRQFDSSAENLEMKDGRIVSIRILDRLDGDMETYTGRIFIDATYEGDLGAAAGVPFRLGRESASEFSEPCAGKVYRWWKHGPDEEGSTYEGDDAIQAYNYRVCLTTDKDNSVPVPKPENYNREEYVSLIEDVYTGRNADIRFKKVTPEQMEANRQRILDGGRTAIPGDPWGMWKVTNMVHLPNAKTDANNQHLALISTDLPEENWPWPTADWEWRDRFARRLRDYTLGLFWFAQHDEALPPQFREACLQYGLAADEYTDNGNFPRQVYVREGRRLEGTYFFTANDVLPVSEGSRPPVNAESVTASHYALDSHAVRKREEGRVHLDGFFSHPSAVYTVPYGVMVPKKVDNLLFPVPVSGSHVGFSTMRMEPCWMALGEAAGVAASLSIDAGCDVRSISVTDMQRILLENGATLIYFKDLKPSDPDFVQVQQLALKGYFPDWNASLDKPLDEAAAALWSRLSGKNIYADGGTRRQWLRALDGNGIHDTVPDWAWTGFERPEGVNPVISPDTVTRFFCPVQKKPVPWEGNDTFNPGAAVHKGKIVVMYRAEDNFGEGIGRRTSRLGYASSEDGLHFRRSPRPVFYPDNDAQKIHEWPGGCEDPRIAVTEDGLYVMFYTQWNRKTARLAVATSRNLKDWTKHGPAFEEAYGGKFYDMFCKSASVVTEIRDGKQVIAKIDGKYWMYWGERFINVATSDNLVDWTPMLDENGDILKIVSPRKGFFDSEFTECGPPAVITDRGILLVYNGKNSRGAGRDRRYTPGSYCAGQLLFDRNDPAKLLGRLDEPFFVPEAPFEKSGQYPDGTVFVEGLVYHHGKWFLYYGCADSRVSVAVMPAQESGAVSAAENESSFRGRNLAVFGNSITAAKDSWAFRVRDSLGFGGFYNGSVGSSVWGKRERPDGVTQDYGTPGFAGIGNSSHPSLQARYNNCAVVHVQKFLSEKPDFEPDVIILSYGTNDMLSEKNEPGLKEALAKRKPGTDEAYGLVGGMVWCLDTLTGRFPDARIVVLLPVRADDSMEKYKDRNRDNLRKMRTMKRICRAFGVEYFDCYHGSGINASNVSSTLLDGLHPNAAGQQLHASYVIRRLENKR